MSIKGGTEFEFNVVNPYKPKYIFPKMFDIIVILYVLFAFFYLIAYSVSNPERPIILSPILSGDLAIFVYILLMLVFVWGPLFVGHAIFIRFFLKYYLTTARVKLDNDTIYINFIHDLEKYCSSHIIHLCDLESYAISNSTMISTVSRNSGLIKNIGIRLKTKGDVIILRLHDFRALPFGDHKEVDRIQKFSEKLRLFINRYNERGEEKIKFKIPLNWIYSYRFLFVALGAIAIAIVLGILISLTIYVFDK
jgi:hypothetical protein